MMNSYKELRESVWKEVVEAGRKMSRGEWNPEKTRNHIMLAIDTFIEMNMEKTNLRCRLGFHHIDYGCYPVKGKPDNFAVCMGGCRYCGFTPEPKAFEWPELPTKSPTR